MKELLTERLNAGLSNLTEKIQNRYIDAAIDKDNIPDSWIKIVNDLVKKIKEFKFTEEDHDNMHPFLKCEKELANELGFDNITVCPYKGQEIPMTFCMSNYIYNGFDNYKCLTIDIYNVYYMEKLDMMLTYLILQEIENFKRDAGWINEGLDVYNQKIDEMKEDNEILN